MKVPYAKKRQKETDELRQIALDCDLTEELKWGKPCFTFLKKNVAIVIPLKESCAFSFFKGALLKDPKHILERIGEHTQAGRWIKFTSPREIAALRSTLKDYLYEAIKLEESGKRIERKKPSEYPIPEELQRKLDNNAVLRSAFATLTPGRRKSYIFHVSSAKQAKTRAARAEKCVPMILSGAGSMSCRTEVESSHSVPNVQNSSRHNHDWGRNHRLTVGNPMRPADHCRAAKGTAFKVWKTMPEDEHYFGLGDKTGPMDHRNLAFTMWNTDQFGWQESTDPLYKDIPFIFGLRNGSAYGLFLDNTYRSSYDFGKEFHDAYSFGSEGGDLDYYFFYGPDPKRVVELYTQLVGH